jgi:phosphatidate phosphatase APP1
MADWRHIFLHLAVDVEDHFDRLKNRLGARLGHVRPLQILAYRTYGTPEKLYIKGRVLQDRGIRSARDEDDTWDNLLNMYRRFESHEIPYARVQASYRDQAIELVADEEGFFEGWIEAGDPADAAPEPGATQAAIGARNAPPDTEAATQGLWRQVSLELLQPFDPAGPVRATAFVLVPLPGVRFGVISDIDDTVVRTDAAHLLHMARTVFLGNARLRLPFEGVAAFYRALYAGAGGHERNPLFYVSNSPWNMYDLFSDFFQMQDIPVGPVLILRDWGLTEEGLAPLGAAQFKLQVIRQIMDTYPDLSFILVGDSGERDPEIYREIVASAPGRILAVYIRNVSLRRGTRLAAIENLARQVVAAGSTLILADDTLPLARHAAAQGWIDPAQLPLVGEAKAADEAPPTPVEQLLGTEVMPRPPTPTVVIKDQAPAPGALAEALQPGQSGDH